MSLLPIFSASLSTVVAPSAGVAAVTETTSAPVQKLEPIEKTTNVKVIRKIGGAFTPSIKDALAGNHPEKKVQEVEQKTIFSQVQEDRNEPFTREQLEARWTEYLSLIADRPNLRSTLSVMPELADANKIIVRIGNSVQEEEVRLGKGELVNWLRDALRNDSIEVITRFEKVESERVIFSDSEKLQMMMQKNPLLIELKQKFNLDFKD